MAHCGKRVSLVLFLQYGFPWGEGSVVILRDRSWWRGSMRRARFAAVLHLTAVLLPVGVISYVLFGWNGLPLVAISALVVLGRHASSCSYWSLRVSDLTQLGAVILAVILIGLGIASSLLLVGLALRPPLFTVGCLAIAALSLERIARMIERHDDLVLVGTPRETDQLLRDIVLHPRRRFGKTTVVTSDGTGAIRVVDVVRRNRPAVVVLGDGPERESTIPHVLAVTPADVRVVGIHQFYEYAFGRVPVEHLSPAWFMSVMHIYRRPYSRAVKRAFDVLMSGVGLLVCAPLLAVLAVLVRCSGPGPVLFRQTRLGEGGRTYQVLKLRTMVDAAEESSGAAWATSDDPRVTRIGAFLRDTRLDEIPRFRNVLRGDMSLVGPRPERPEFLDRLQRDVPFWTARHMVKPGLTGWAQLNIGYTSDAGGAAEKLSYDLYYLRHSSLWMDIVISLATIQFMALGVLSRAPRHAPRTLAAPEPVPAVQNPDASTVSSMTPGQWS